MRHIHCLLLLGSIACGPPAWREAQRTGTANAYEDFAANYSRYDQANTAMNRAESIRWDKAMESGEAAQWSAYLREHFAAKRAPEARKHLDAAAYGEALADKDPLALERYLSQFPDGAHRKEARSKLDGVRWQSVKEEDTHTAYRRYLMQEPDGAHRDKAAERYAERIWERAARIDDLRSYRTYLEEFPGGEHSEDAKTRVGQLQFTEVQLAVALGKSAQKNRVSALSMLKGEASAVLTPLLKSNGFTVKSTVLTADLGADGALDPGASISVAPGVGLVVVVLDDGLGEPYKPRGHEAVIAGSVRVYVPARGGAMATWPVAGRTSDRVHALDESGLYKSAANEVMRDALGVVSRVRAWHPSPP